ncbi:MAG: DUF3093 domain-containing protein [Nocardioides sp.]|jgi:hypothetical protein
MTAVTYDERLSVPLRWWVQGTMLVASLWLAVIVAMPLTAAWVVSAIALALLSALFLAYGAARVRVADGVLSAGQARIEVRFLGEPETLDAHEARLAAGRDADARAYFLLRPYLKRAVRIPLEDPADPTPYWLINTRRPDRLAAAITEAKAPTRP